MKHQMQISILIQNGVGEWVQDTEGQVMVSKSSSGTFATLGSNIGSETKTLSVDNLPSHNHTSTGSSHTHSIPVHSHGLNSHTHTYAKANDTSESTTLTIDQIPSHTHGEAGSHGHKLNFRQPVDNTGHGLGVPPVSKSSSFVGQDDATVVSSGAHTHSSVGGGQGHTHSITLTSTNTDAASGNTANSSALTSGETTQGGTIGNTGSGAALSVVQNSKVCIRWHRIS